VQRNVAIHICSMDQSTVVSCQSKEHEAQSLSCSDVNDLLMTVKAVGHLVEQTQHLQHHGRSYTYRQQVFVSTSSNGAHKHD